MIVCLFWIIVPFFRRKTVFGVVKGRLWRCERLPFAVWKTTFGKTKGYLSQKQEWRHAPKTAKSGFPFSILLHSQVLISFFRMLKTSSSDAIPLHFYSPWKRTEKRMECNFSRGVSVWCRSSFAFDVISRSVLPVCQNKSRINTAVSKKYIPLYKVGCISTIKI